jgi:hypothetical protein
VLDDKQTYHYLTSYPKMRLWSSDLYFLGTTISGWTLVTDPRKVSFAHMNMTHQLLWAPSSKLKLSICHGSFIAEISVNPLFWWSLSTNLIKRHDFLASASGVSTLGILPFSDMPSSLSARLMPKILLWPMRLCLALHHLKICASVGWFSFPAQLISWDSI